MQIYSQPYLHICSYGEALQLSRLRSASATNSLIGHSGLSTASRAICIPVLHPYLLGCIQPMRAPTDDATMPASTAIRQESHHDESSSIRKWVRYPHSHNLHHTKLHRSLTVTGSGIGEEPSLTPAARLTSLTSAALQKRRKIQSSPVRPSPIKCHHA